MNSTLLVRCLFVILPLSPVEQIWGQAVVAKADTPMQGMSAFVQPNKLPFRLYWDYLPVVEGAIGKFHGLNFLVDTGASPSVVDQKIVHRLQLSSQPARVSLSNTSIQTQLVVLPSLRLGPVKLQSIPVLSEDLSAYQNALGCRVDAIVGMDVLRKSSFMIDYKHKELHFGPIKALTFSAPFETDEPVVTIPIQLQKNKFRLVVDSGGPDIMLFRSRISNDVDFEPLAEQRVADVNGSFQRRSVRISEVYVGGVKIGSQIAFITDDRKDDGDNFDGVLGVRGLQFLKIAFDFEHRMFWWER